MYMAVIAVSPRLPAHSLESLVRVFGSGAVDRIVAATAVTGLLASGVAGEPSIAQACPPGK